jgi:hypothetical protein
MTGATRAQIRNKDIGNGLAKRRFAFPRRAAFHHQPNGPPIPLIRNPSHRSEIAVLDCQVGAMIEEDRKCLQSLGRAPVENIPPHWSAGVQAVGIGSRVEQELRWCGSGFHDSIQGPVVRGKGTVGIPASVEHRLDDFGRCRRLVEVVEPVCEQRLAPMRSVEIANLRKEISDKRSIVALKGVRQLALEGQKKLKSPAMRWSLDILSKAL